jgi:glutathione S-transferase
MLKIYHVKGTRSERVIWACEELELEYQVINVDWTPAHRRSEAWRAMHPLGKVPVLEDHHLRMTESAAMVQYVLDRYGKNRLQPVAGTEQAAKYLEWNWFAEASFARPLGDMIHHMILKPEAERIPAVVVDARARAQLCLNHVEQHLQQQHHNQQHYLMDGGLTGADIVMGWSLDVATTVKLLTPDGAPNTWDYRQRLMARPAYKVATANF